MVERSSRTGVRLHASCPERWRPLPPPGVRNPPTVSPLHRSSARSRPDRSFCKRATRVRTAADVRTRARSLAASGLACLGRHTVSGLLCTAGQQFVDWSGAYRLFERERLDLEGLWRVPRHDILTELPASAPVVALIDDTLVRKRGQH